MLPADDNMRALCLRVLQAQGHDELGRALADLKGALRERILEIENLGVHMILKAQKRSLGQSQKAMQF